MLRLRQGRARTPAHCLNRHGASSPSGPDGIPSRTSGSPQRATLGCRGHARGPPPRTGPQRGGAPLAGASCLPAGGAWPATTDRRPRRRRHRPAEAAPRFPAALFRPNGLVSRVDGHVRGSALPGLRAHRLLAHGRPDRPRRARADPRHGFRRRRARRCDRPPPDGAPERARHDGLGRDAALQQPPAGPEALGAVRRRRAGRRLLRDPAALARRADASPGRARGAGRRERARLVPRHVRRARRPRACRRPDRRDRVARNLRLRHRDLRDLAPLPSAHARRASAA